MFNATSEMLFVLPSERRGQKRLFSDTLAIAAAAAARQCGLGSLFFSFQCLCILLCI